MRYSEAKRTIAQIKPPSGPYDPAPVTQDWRGPVNHYMEGALDHFLQGRRSNVPSLSYTDKIAQAQNYAGIIYLPIAFAATQLSRAKITLYEHNYDPRDVDGRKRVHALDPIYDIFRRPNPNSTFRDILYGMSQMMDLHGEAYVWLPPVDSQTGRVSLYGEPLEMYVIPSAWVTGLPSCPWWEGGAYQVTPYITQSPSGYSSVFIPAEQMLRIYDPHPLLDRTAMSVLQAISQTVDTVRGIDQARASQQQQGCQQSLVLELDAQWANPGAVDVKRVREIFEKAYAGARNAGKTVIMPPGVTAKNISFQPDDMEWVEGWSQLADFALACYGVNKAASGMSGDLNYATLFASIKQVYWSKFEPRLEQFEQAFDKDLIQRFLSVDHFSELKLPKMDDETLKLQGLQMDLSCGALNYGQYLRERGYEVDPDVTPWLNERAWSKGPATTPKDPATPGQDPAVEASRPRNEQGAGPLGGDGARLLLNSQASQEKLLGVFDRALVNGSISTNGKH